MYLSAHDAATPDYFSALRAHDRGILSRLWASLQGH